MQDENLQPFDIRRCLYDEVGSILKCEKNLERLESTVALSNELYDLLNSGDLQKINDNSMMVRMIIDVMINKDNSEQFYDSFMDIVRKLIYLEEQEQQNTKKYKDYKTKFMLIHNKFNEFRDKNIEYRNKYKAKFEEVKPLLISYRRILSKIKYGNVVDEKELQYIDYLMDKHNVSVEDQINTKEMLRIHNQKIEHPHYTVSYTIGKMLKDECETIIIDDEEKVKHANLKNYIVSVYSGIKQNDENYINFLKEIKEYYSKEEYLFILANIINMLVEERKSTIDEMKEFYDDEDLRKVTIASYGEVLDKMVNIYCLYNNARFEEEKQEDIIEEEAEELTDDDIKTNIYFAFNEQGEALLEKDLKNIRKEKLEELADLIKGKKYGKLKPEGDQQLINSDKLKHYRELRGDQVRIIYRNLSGNNILIVGAFIKKTDNDRLNYTNIAKRISDETAKWYSDNIENIKNTSEEAYIRIAKYVGDHKRMGSR